MRPKRCYAILQLLLAFLGKHFASCQLCNGPSCEYGTYAEHCFASGEGGNSNGNNGTALSKAEQRERVAAALMSSERGYRATAQPRTEKDAPIDVRVTFMPLHIAVVSCNKFKQKHI